MLLIIDLGFLHVDIWGVNALQVMMITRMQILESENYLLNQSVEFVGAVQEKIPLESAQLGSAALG
jgi:hypothetical protein